MTRLPAAALLCLASFTACAEPPGFGNPGSFAAALALPTPGRGDIVPAGTSAWDWTADLSNEYVHQGGGADEILMDGETARIAGRWRQGFAEGWEWGVELPVLSRGGGFLDHTIESWHDAIGLPNGGRNLAPSNEYHYRYVHAGRTVIDTDDEYRGLGDAQLAAGWQLAPGTALRAMAKLPSGSKNHLAGGTSGGALWLDWNTEPGRWSAYLSGGISASTKGPLGDEQRRVVPFAGAGLDLALGERWDLFGQIYAHQSVGKDGAEFAPLAHNALPMALGISWRAGAHTTLDLAFQEDLEVNASPDFSLRLGLRFL